MPKLDYEYQRLGNPANYHWEVVSKEMTDSLVESLKSVDGQYRVDASTTEFGRCSLAWYPGYYLYQLRDMHWGDSNLSLYYLASSEQDLIRLKGAAPVINEVNVKSPIVLNEKTVLDYLCFFCFFVRGDEGPFYIFESMQDANLPNDPIIQKILVESTRPAVFEGYDNQGNYLTDAVIFYGDVVFIGNFEINSKGMIQLVSDEPIASDLPFRINLPIK